MLTQREISKEDDENVDVGWHNNVRCCSEQIRVVRKVIEYYKLTRGRRS
jgi:hypothetical protein